MDARWSRCGLLAFGLGALLGCKRKEASPEGAAAKGALLVPQPSSALTIDGEADEGDWKRPARSGPFHNPENPGEAARPYSEARFLWDAQNLYLYLYASDENVTATTREHDGPVTLEDAFQVRLQPAGGATYGIDFAPNQVLADYRVGPGDARDLSWESHATFGVDLDGTLNHPGDWDEEWVIEAAVPWASLGVVPREGQTLALQIARCDLLRNKMRRCGAWSSTLALGPALPPLPPRAAGLTPAAAK